LRRARPDLHAPYRELLAVGLVDALTADETQALQDHLGRCERCSLLREEYAREQQALRALRMLDAPRDLWARTSAALDHELARDAGRRRQPSFDPFDPPRRGASAGAVLATVLVSLVVVAVVGGGLLPLAVLGPSDALARATPFSIPPQELAYVGTDAEGLAIYRASVDRVCPRAMDDCAIEVRSDRQGIRGAIARSARSAALGPDGHRLAISGEGADGRLVYAIVELGPRPPGAAAGGSTSIDPTESNDRQATPEETTGSAGQSDDGGQTSTPRNANSPEASRTLAASPPDVTIPPGPSPDEAVVEEAQAILAGVVAAGAPPAWSPDGSMLAFSAAPADGSAGPDIYIWRPGDQEATLVTTDHAWYFASWAGSRIVANRATVQVGPNGAQTGLALATVVIDPSSGEQRNIEGARLWLPTVDPTGRWLIGWRGRLAADALVPSPITGSLLLADWRRLDPFSRRGADPQAALRDATVIRRGSTGTPLQDWEVRWSDDGRAYAVWIAHRPGLDFGELIVTATRARSGEERPEILLGPTSARRAFTVGLDKAAWVQPGTDGGLRVGTWGESGPGQLRVTVRTGQVFPAF
jgi:hypothetical protein